MPSNVKLLAGASGGEPTDANFKNVTLLLHGDGSNGAQNNTFIDSSTNNFTITRNGNTTQGSFSPYGSNWSNYFDGSGDYLTATSNAAFQFGTGDFTIEAWIYVTNYASTCAIFDTRTSGNEASGVIFYVRSDGKIELYRSAAVVTASTALSQNSWNHVAVTRSGSTCTLWLNGVSVGTATDSTNLTQQNSFIGAAYTGSANMMVGYISNLRVVKGTAVYTSAFTPSTTPLTAITNTSLLTCAYNRFRDGSTNNFTITRNGDVKVTNFAPFAPSSAYSTTTNGGSGYFDGTGDYLDIPSSTAFALGTGDFTIEAWVYTTDTSFMLFASQTAGGVGFGYNIDSGSQGLWLGRVGQGVDATSGVQLTYNQWNHISVTRQSNSVKFFVNGVQSGSTQTVSTNYGTSAQAFYVGRDYGGSVGFNYLGYASSARLVKGTAVYTADFTPPTSPVTAITNTSLLTNFTNAAIFDNSMKNDLETVGNAQISTSVKKFGTGSMYFDGNGDALVAAYNDALNVTSGDFTIEGWVYFNAVSGTPTLITPFGTGTDYGGWVIALDSSSRFTYYLSSSVNSWNLASNVLFSSTAAVTGTWYHFALVRSGSTFTPYLNGTAGTTTTTSSALYNHLRPIKLGAEKDANSFPLNGYLDDVRITKGVARYTSNFTAPTAPFPNK